MCTLSGGTYVANNASVVSHGNVANNGASICTGGDNEQEKKRSTFTVLVRRSERIRMPSIRFTYCDATSEKLCEQGISRFRISATF